MTELRPLIIATCIAAAVLAALVYARHTYATEVVPPVSCVETACTDEDRERQRAEREAMEPPEPGRVIIIVVRGLWT